MKPAKLIKKVEQVQPAPTAQPATDQLPQTLTKLTRQTVQQWIAAHKRTSSQNPRAAFEALFTART